MTKFRIEFDTEELSTVHVFRNEKEIPVILLKYLYKTGEAGDEHGAPVDFEIIHGDDHNGATRLHSRTEVSLAKDIIVDRKDIEEII